MNDPVLPLLPPDHSICVRWQDAGPMTLSESGKAGLTDGVEVYVWHGTNISARRNAAPGADGWIFFRGVYAAMEPRSRSAGILVRRNSPVFPYTFIPIDEAAVIPAELVDAGLLGPENVMREDL